MDNISNTQNREIKERSIYRPLYIQRQRNDKDAETKMTDININARHVIMSTKYFFFAIPDLFIQSSLF